MKREAVPTLGEMLASCGRNRDVAERQLQGARDRMRRLEPGPERESLKVLVSRFKAEFDHWANYAGYYRERVAKEGADTRPSMQWTMDTPAKPTKPTLAAVPPEREPGADDLSDLPF